MSEDIRETMTEWVELKNQLAQARKDLAILNKREKHLKSFIKTYMKQNTIDVARVDGARISYAVRRSKGTLTRDVIKTGLKIYFSGDEVAVDEAFQAILDAAPETEKDLVTLKK